MIEEKIFKVCSRWKQLYLLNTFNDNLRYTIKGSSDSFWIPSSFLFPQYVSKSSILNRFFLVFMGNVGITHFKQPFFYFSRYRFRIFWFFPNSMSEKYKKTQNTLFEASSTLSKILLRPSVSNLFWLFSLFSPSPLSKTLLLRN